MIKLNNITLAYDENIVPIKDFSYTFTKGVYAVMGKSGCGKSTLLKGLMGLVELKAGSIDNNMSCAVVFQENRLIMSYSPVANLKLVCNSMDRINEVLSLVELSEHSNRPVIQLSGGQQRRVAIARALCIDADYIILDEAFEGLDSGIEAKIAKIIGDRFPLIIAASHNEQDFALLAGNDEYNRVVIE